MRQTLLQSLIWFGLLLTSSVSLLGQTSSATISGRITDTTGAIAGAAIELTSVDRGTVTTGSTNTDGLYTFGSVQSGTYRILARREGFKQAEVANLQVEVGSRIEQNFQLEVGSVVDSITVETAEPQVNTLSATISSVVAGAPIQDLPLNGRDTLQLALTQPGVMPSSSAGGGFSIAGARPNAVSYLLDGGNNNSVANGGAVVNPNPDTIAEFRILTNSYSAEFGRNNGGVVNVVTKSGTNQIHGSAFDYLRNTALNANNFFNNASPTYIARPVLRRNQYGGTIGGPITIPKVVDGRDKLFFFFGYQGQKQSEVQVGSQVATFTPAQLNGDFSRSSTGVPDARVAQFLQSHPYFQGDPLLAAQAIIDPTRIDPVAKSFVTNNLIPSSPTGILTPNVTASDNRYEFLGKTDLNFTANQRLSVTLVRSNAARTSPFGGGNVPGYGGISSTNNYFGGLAYTWVLSSTLVNEAHATVQRVLSRSNDPAVVLPTSQELGMKITPDLATGPPQLSFNQTGLSTGFANSTPGKFADTTYAFSDNLSWNRGRHTIKLGGSANIVQNNGYFAFQTNGRYIFNGASGIGSGLDLADFLLGIPDQYAQWPAAFSALRSRQLAGHAQDEWKVAPNLTLTVGLRYEYSSPKTDPQSRNYMIIPGLQSKRFPLAPLGLLFPGDPGAPSKGVTFPDRNDWAPRFGIAWDPFGKGKTSIRAGFGVFYDVLNGQDNQNQNGTVPFYSASNVFFTKALIPANGATGFLGDPYGTTGTVNPFPSKPPTAATNFQTAGFLPLGPSSVFLSPYMRTPYTYQYNFSLQQSLGRGLAAEIGYVGSSSHKLVVNRDDNSFILGTTIRPMNLQPGLQYPNAFAQFNLLDGTWGNANYNGLLASVTKRSSNVRYVGTSFFTASYTWSHTLSYADAYGSLISAYNPRQFYSNANFDVRHRLVVSGGWELPFNQYFSKAPKAVTTGWSLYPIFSTQTGFPVDFNAGLTRNGTNPGPSGDGEQGLVRPDWDGRDPKYLDPRSVQTFTFNGRTVTGRFFVDPSGLSTPACYSATVAPGTPGGCATPSYGTLQRNTLRGPGMLNLDLSLEKKTFLTERVQVLFRAELFNFLNHTQFVSAGGQVSVRSAFAGQTTSTKDPRIGQLALKFIF